MVLDPERSEARCKYQTLKCRQKFLTYNQSQLNKCPQLHSKLAGKQKSKTQVKLAKETKRSNLIHQQLNQGIYIFLM